MARTPQGLALVGTALSAVLGSIASVVVLLDAQTLDEYRFWLVGSLAGRGWATVTTVAPLLLAGARPGGPVGAQPGRPRTGQRQRARPLSLRLRTAIAPTVLVETTGPQWRENVTFLGEVLGAEDEAAEQLADYQERARTIGATIDDKAGDPTISVAGFLDGPTRLMQKSSFIGHVLSDAGLARPASQDVDDFAAEVGEEQIRLADGDHIFVTSCSGGEPAKERLQRNPLWAQLDGV